MGARDAAPGRKRLGLALIVALAGLALIGIAQAIPNRHSIEDNLTRRSTTALEAADIRGVQVRFVGRDGSLVVPTDGEVEKAREVVAALAGVRVVSARGPVGTTPLRPPVVTISVDNGITVAGQVPSDKARNALVSTLGDAGMVQDRLAVDAGVSDTSLDRLAAVVKALPAGTKGVTIELRDNKISLVGTVPDAHIRETVVRVAGEAFGATNVIDRFTIAAPPETVQRKLTELPQITFEYDSATLTAAGQAAVAEAALILRDNPQAKVRIEGHTDGNGSDAANLTLSQARAETVRNALVASGIAADRLTAAGYGEGRHKVPDTTPDNQAINRRVEFVVL